MKVVDTKEYVSVLRELTDTGKEVSMLIAGNSMSPFLVHQRDSIRFRKPDRPLKIGDMVFYQRKNGQFLMHRICRVRPEGYDIVGDAQWLIEDSVERNQIFSIVTGVQRKGKWIGPGNFWWEFFEHVWIRVIPLRRLIIGVYSVCFRKRLT